MFLNTEDPLVLSATENCSVDIVKIGMGTRQYEVDS